MNIFIYWITLAKRCFLFLYLCHSGWLPNSACTCRNQNGCAPASKLALAPYTRDIFSLLWSWHHLEQTPSLRCRVQARYLGSWGKMLSAATKCFCAEGPQTHREVRNSRNQASVHMCCPLNCWCRLLPCSDYKVRLRAMHRFNALSDIDGTGHGISVPLALLQYYLALLLYYFKGKAFISFRTSNAVNSNKKIIRLCSFPD